MLTEKNVVLGVTAGIAAYKAAALASLLVKQHAKVQVIMTENAQNFIHPLTFESITKQKCLIDTFDRNFEYKIGHISIAKSADYVVIAPATADIIGKLAGGIADDMLTTTVMACNCKKLIVPAMNTNMYQNSIVQDNINKLKQHGYEVMEPAYGLLACGDTGLGKMPEPADILPHILKELAYEKDYAGKKVLITAGATIEKIDPVRFISNHSTGKMGYALAKAAMLRGADVTLISGRTSLNPPEFVNTIFVESASDMFEAVKANYKKHDVIIKSAAVADYTPIQTASEKIKKKDGNLELQLKRTEDILGYLGTHKGEQQFLCGFSMETENMIDNSREKLRKKGADMIVANNLKQEGAGFGVNTNIVTLITQNRIKQLEKATKEHIAHEILNEIKVLLDK